MPAGVAAGLAAGVGGSVGIGLGTGLAAGVATGVPAGVAMGDGAGVLAGLPIRVAPGVAAGEASGRPGEEGHAGDLIVHGPLLAVAVVGEAVSVVAGEEDYGVVQDALAFESLENFTHLFVDHGDIGEVVCALVPALFLGRIEGVNNGVVVDFDVVDAHALEWWWLGVEVFG